ncbi:DUF2065 domain-containing protein [Rhodoplanes sp. TEM]|uniref:DUF2065 domain-containing protein n=1 Tax=Rhodoplanes tepidamans TaxID=200616 RepID=A0ABT5J7F1_RHOTP|nr:MULTISPECIES: DUF2065 domain-containing protein [Rhodoplanes]MDC7785578.1 DUF2065 domain-containing protein [Rhodoplanes tepidamans]MDC7985223.1 DUF2065 domain-containing protein [Rhodoplanes sp. TEM]MDQ0353252.1 uncharacterized protein YjeT (DUF2065 family) [Rhodoplanes tepidamans]
MSAFLVALGLVFVIEGLLFAAFPGPARRAALALLETPEHTLRIVGVVSAAIGVALIWLIRLLS